MANLISFKEHTTDRKFHLLLALYDEALHSVVEARQEMEKSSFLPLASPAAAAEDIFSPPSFPTGSTGRKDRHISRAMEIIAELKRSLKPDIERDSREASSGLARNISRLYLLCTSKLLAARAQAATDQLDDVAIILRKLRNAYALYDMSDADRKATAGGRDDEASPCGVS